MITDNDLIKKIKKENCSDSIIELQNRHIGLIINIYQRYGGVLASMDYKQSDFNDEIKYLIYDSARKFDLRRRIKFSTWLAENIRFFCLNKITELNKTKIISAEPEDMIKIMDEKLSSDNNNHKSNHEACDYIFSILNQLKDDRITKIFSYRYFDGKEKMIWKDIGEKMGLTSQSCINIHDKAIKFLKSKLISSDSIDKI